MTTEQLRTFWRDLEVISPNAIKYFQNWFEDYYKKEVNWTAIFPNDPKFIDLPIDLQHGIIARFELELFNRSRNVATDLSESFLQSYKNLFADIQRQYEIRLATLN